jgi:BirA family biotin operon repressor/biotin-[acetyl-CoA-carboxylase] ligase
MSATGAESGLVQRVFAALSDRSFHSGESLASAAGVTRSAVWKAIGTLRELGLVIDAATHRGYRLAEPGEALDAGAIGAGLSPEVSARLRSLEVAWSIPSTNAALLAVAPPPVGAFDVLLAEHQYQGRGRRGRRWLAPVGGSLCLSIGTSLDPLPRDLPALTLAIGVCLLRALRHWVAPSGAGLALKWPNDLVSGDAKLGGILVELRAEAGGAGHVVVGVGLNLRLGAQGRADVAAEGTVAVDLESLGADVHPRNRLAAAVVGQCAEGLAAFASQGFAPFIDQWRAADALLDRPVQVLGGAGAFAGVARGIDAQGVLQVETPAGAVRGVSSGEVSVRGSLMP